MPEATTSIDLVSLLTQGWGHVLQVLVFMGTQLLKSWPLLVITIPLAVTFRHLGGADRVRAVMGKKPVVAVVLATLLGSLSPLCSCSVIPVISALLVSGVPLAPVMSFWLASPSMDPEIFFVSVGVLGWDLAVWRFAATLVMSLGAGLVTMVLEQRGFFGESPLKGRFRDQALLRKRMLSGGLRMVTPLAVSPGTAPDGPGRADTASPTPAKPSWTRLIGPIAQESGRMILWLGGFMAVAWLLEALIVLYMPAEWITSPLGTDSPWAVPLALGLGLPFYTSTMAALGLVGGLLAKGMAGGAALTFLIGGATTTIPAMSAVWGIATRRVFAIYLGSTAVVALVTGLLYQLVAGG